MRDNYQTMSAMCPKETPLYTRLKPTQMDVEPDWLFLLAMACIKNATGIEPLYACWN